MHTHYLPTVPSRRSPEIRKGVLKGLGLSAVIALLIFFFELAFFPAHLFRQSSSDSQQGMSAHDEDDLEGSVGRVGSVFWLYPLVAGSYFLAASWTMDVANAAHKLKHGRGLSMSAQNMFPPGTSRRIVLESYRVILVVNYALISFALQQIPFVGRWLAFFFMSFIDAYYCFEQAWIARGWSIDRRMRYAESRWAYFVAFGLPSTLVSFFHPSGLLNLMLFMLVFPVCTVLAMLATPQPRQAPTGAATLTPANSGLSPSLANNATLSGFLPPRLPIFWPTIKLYRLILRCFPRIMDANILATPVVGGSSAWRQTFPGTSFFGGGNSNSGSANGTPNAAPYGGSSSIGYGATPASRGMYGSAPASTGYGGSAGGMGTGMIGSTTGLASKRGAMAAQFVDGAWGGQGLGSAMAPGAGTGAGAGVTGAGAGVGGGPHARPNAGYAAANEGSPSLGGPQNGTHRYDTPSPKPSGAGGYDSVVSYAAAPTASPWATANGASTAAADAPGQASHLPPPPRGLAGKKKD